MISNCRVQSVLPQGDQIQEMVPLGQDIAQSFLDAGRAEVTLRYELITNGRDVHELQLVGLHVRFESLMLGYEQIH